MSKPKLLIIGVILVLCVGAIVLLFKTPEASGRFINHTVPGGEFKFAYPSPYYLLADYITSYPEKPTITNELERRELNVHVIEYNKLVATRAEACREQVMLNPGEKCGPPLPVTQEELLQKKIEIEKTKEGLEIILNPYISGRVIFADGIHALYSLYYSEQAGIYYVRLSAFTSKNNLIWLEAPLWGVTSLGMAEKDVRVIEFAKIISTLKFSK